MADEKDFKYDPEAEENSKKYRLPFALCKHYGIPIQDWWTPRDAWNALKNGGVVNTVSEEYKKYYRDLKKKMAEQSRIRSKRKKNQLKDPIHNPDKNYKHQDGQIAGISKGKPMSFDEADSGSVNPFYADIMTKGVIGYSMNCQTCVATFIARRQGYDLRALPNLNNKNIYRLSHNTNLAYFDSNGNHPQLISKPKGKRVDMWLEQTIKKGEIYSIEFGWGQSKNGHIITVERNENGEVQLYDPQTNEKQSKDIAKYFSNTRDIKIMNLTNVTMDESFCDTIMKGVKNGQ